MVDGVWVVVFVGVTVCVNVLVGVGVTVDVVDGVAPKVGVDVGVDTVEHKVTVVIEVPAFCHHKTYLGVDTSDVADNARYLFAKLSFGRLVLLSYIKSPVVN